MFTVKELRILSMTFDAKDYKLPTNADVKKIVNGFLLREEEKREKRKERERERIRSGDTRYHQMTGLETIAHWFSHYDFLY